MEGGQSWRGSSSHLPPLSRAGLCAPRRRGLDPAASAHRRAHKGQQGRAAAEAQAHHSSLERLFGQLTRRTQGRPKERSGTGSRWRRERASGPFPRSSLVTGRAPEERRGVWPQQRRTVPVLAADPRTRSPSVCPKTERSHPWQFIPRRGSTAAGGPPRTQPGRAACPIGSPRAGTAARWT